jgi:hypothetical protein
LLIIQPELYGVVVNFLEILVMVAGTALKPVTNEIFAGFGFFPAFFVAKTHQTVHACIFLVMKGHKISSWQPVKTVFAAPLLVRIKVAMLKLPCAD